MGDPNCTTCLGRGEVLDYDGAPGGAFTPCPCAVRYSRAEYYAYVYPNWVGRTVLEDEHNRRALALMDAVATHGGNAYLHGLPGRGKTFPAWSAARSISMTPPYPRGLIIHHPTWIANLQASNAPSYEGRPYLLILGQAQLAPLLVLDDFGGGYGSKQPTDYAIAQTYMLMDHRIRYPNLITIVTSNIAPPSWKEIWGERVSSRMGGLFLDRIVRVQGPDRRPMKAKIP